MKKEIWKYTIDGIMNEIKMPMDAQVLTVQIQNGQPQIWALVNPQNETEIRTFTIVGTGNPFDSTNTKYVGTFQDVLFVWHLFEIIH